MLSVTPALLLLLNDTGSDAFLTEGRRGGGVTSEAHDHVGGLHEHPAHILRAGEPVVGRNKVHVAGQVWGVVAGGLHIPATPEGITLSGIL